MLMTTREDILERVARIPIMAQDPGSGFAMLMERILNLCLPCS